MSGKNKEKDEEDCSCYAKNRTSDACPPVRNVTHPLRYYEFTQDEIKALEECDKESFYQRCLPFSTLFATITYAAIKYGHLRPNPRFGAIPKVTLAVTVGYFMGKLSYQQACAEKLMALPGSYIGQLLRERRDGQVSGGTSMRKKAPSMYGAGPNDIYSDAGPGSSLDLDNERPLFNEDTYVPDADGSGASRNPSPGLEPSRAPLSYDELRRQNRGEMPEAKHDPYRMDDMPLVSRLPMSLSPAPSRNKIR